jgi:hypothetical protein
MLIFRHKLDKIIASLSFLESRVSRISASSSEYAIKDLKESIQRIMGRLEAMEVSYIFYVNNLGIRIPTKYFQYVVLGPNYRAVSTNTTKPSRSKQIARINYIYMVIYHIFHFHYSFCRWFYYFIPNKKGNGSKKIYLINP